MKKILLTLLLLSPLAFADCSSDYIKHQDVQEFAICQQTELHSVNQPLDEPIEISSQPTLALKNFILVSSYDELTSTYIEGMKRKQGDALKAEAINISTGERWHVGNYQDNYLRKWVRTLCEIETKSMCVISRYMKTTYYVNLADYEQKQIEGELRATEYLKQKKIEDKALAEEREQWILENKKSNFLELECKLGETLDEESKPIKIRIEIKVSKSGEYSGRVWYPKSTAPPFHRGYISGNTIRYKFESISVSDKEITGGVDRSFASFHTLTINRYSGSIESDDGGDYWSRTGECIALEEQKF